MLKLKAKKSTEPRPQTKCQASRCRAEEDLYLVEAGDRFPVEEGQVVLCGKHLKMTEPPADNEAALVSAMAGDEAPAPPAADPGSVTVSVPVGGTEQAMAQEAGEAKEILAMVEAFQIVTQEDMDFANECLGDVKTKLKELEAEKKKATQPLNDALKTIRGWFKPAIDFYGAAEKAWKSRMSAFARVQAEAQQRALAQVEAAHQAGDVQGVAQAMTQAGQAQVTLPDNVSMRERWVVEISDPYSIPAEYWSPDPKKLEAAVAEGVRQIPGCKIYRDDVVARRGA